MNQRRTPSTLARTRDVLACVALSAVTSLMVAIPGAPDDMPDTWWLALVLAALTLGCVFSRRTILVGATIGVCVPIAQWALVRAHLTTGAVPLFSAHSVAVLPAIAASIAGGMLRRTIATPVIPVRG